MSESIGFVGLGNMGRAMAETLLKAGYGLRVYNRDTRKAQTLVAAGAQQVMRPSARPSPGAGTALKSWRVARITPRSTKS